MQRASSPANLRASATRSSQHSIFRLCCKLIGPGLPRPRPGLIAPCYLHLPGRSLKPSPGKAPGLCSLHPPVTPLDFCVGDKGKEGKVSANHFLRSKLALSFGHRIKPQPNSRRHIIGAHLPHSHPCSSAPASRASFCSLFPKLLSHSSAFVLAVPSAPHALPQFPRAYPSSNFSTS